ncbi:hypothetical protein LV564_00225 (plasmid) [Komagataeibacter nataicola]|uniref:hypothetical protein n=1 Tax=Komagataeibacter nataicola TaxID=265960 RepID=UPI0023DD555B|nr:hypothetical protein [Komagataeibacter nataicola]WEQ54303.1 hypothetical protein LV564_00225 [Komagataeibacter nataicola]
MSRLVFDLETVFETLSLQIERCHYLARRSELERNAVYTADEFDLLAVYQANQFNVGEAEFDGTHLECKLPATDALLNTSGLVQL